jgi:hypothetical protein
MYTEKGDFYGQESFFTTDHCQGVESGKRGKPLGDDWVPCTSYLPMTVVERPGIEDGVVDTLEKFLVLRWGTRWIPNPDPDFRVPEFEDVVVRLEEDLTRLVERIEIYKKKD